MLYCYIFIYYICQKLNNHLGSVRRESLSTFLSVPAVLEQLEVVPEPGHLAVDVLFLLVGEEGGRHHTAADQLLGRENLRGN